MDDIKNITRPPFATYDIVVYFGGGLFFLPISMHYLLNPMEMKILELNIFSKSFSTLNVIITAISLAYTLYIIGHILSYLSSQIIEKYFDSIFGKVSAIIQTSVEIDRKKLDRNNTIKRMIKINLNKYKENNNFSAIIIRTVSHIPVIPAYCLMYILNIFGYFNSRINYTILDHSRIKFSSINPNFPSIGIDKNWFKMVEFYVINRHGSARDRMYNYLVISGILRTSSLIFLISLWFEIIYMIHYLIFKEFVVSPFLSNINTIEYRIYTMISFFILYLFCFLSYLKFRRRYVEEAIFAFCLAD